VLEDAHARTKAVATERDFVEYCVQTAANMAAGETELLLRAKVLPEKLNEIIAELISLNRIIKLPPSLFIHIHTIQLAEQQLLNIVRDFHHTKPDSPGIAIDRFCELSRLQKNVFDGIVKLLISNGTIIVRKHCLALPDHCESFTEAQQKLLTTVESLFSTRLFNPPKLEEIVQDTAAGLQEAEKAIKILIEQEQLIQIEKNLFFHRNAIDKACELLTAFIEKEGLLESVKFKYLLDTTRKFAIPLLDYFDQIGVTRRVGNTRYLKKSL
jgi:selenocysteine-specific elongation factor